MGGSYRVENKAPWSLPEDLQHVSVIVCCNLIYWFKEFQRVIVVGLSAQFGFHHDLRMLPKNHACWCYTYANTVQSGYWTCMCANPHTVKARDHISSIFTLDDGFPVLSIPVLKLGVELDGDDLQVPRVMVPGEVTVHTDYIYIGSLGIAKDKGEKMRWTPSQRQKSGNKDCI